MFEPPRREEREEEKQTFLKNSASFAPLREIRLQCGSVSTTRGAAPIQNPQPKRLRQDAVAEGGGEESEQG